MLWLYWKIGNAILQQQAHEGWGTKVIERLAHAVRREFPDMKGISARNLKYMRAFAEAWPDFWQAPLAQNAELSEQESTGMIVQDPLTQITWYYHITILYKVKAAEGSWSRNVLVCQIAHSGKLS